MLAQVLPIIGSRGSSKKALKDLDFLVRESEDEYQTRAESHLTSAELAEFRRNPCLYRKKKLGLAVDQNRSAFLFDQAAHVLILRGRDRFEREFAVSGAVDEFLDEPQVADVTTTEEQAGAQTRPVLTSEDAALLDELVESVWSHRLAVELLSRGMVNGVIRATYRTMAGQARLDWMNPSRGLIELKLCDHLEWFPGEARAFGYLHELAFARALILAATGIAVPATFVAVEKRQPHRTGVFNASEKVLGEAQRENEEAMERLARCRATERWPTGYEEQRTIDYL